jgi:hypothetical protein
MCRPRVVYWCSTQLCHSCRAGSIPVVRTPGLLGLKVKPPGVSWEHDRRTAKDVERPREILTLA